LLIEAPNTQYDLGQLSQDPHSTHHPLQWRCTYINAISERTRIQRSLANSSFVSSGFQVLQFPICIQFYHPRYIVLCVRNFTWSTHDKKIGAKTTHIFSHMRFDLDYVARENKLGLLARPLLVAEWIPNKNEIRLTGTVIFLSIPSMLFHFGKWSP
jgi:hypothetical protein